ncbi:signal peptidase I [Zhihengliuella flava]|uniref:Signal peptidase I n=1 Tax=Zhihengliuella flava TaxID=1285193 RepID=A0A931DAU8_9MICC|nr:signal peptidase I [Zhihengliuella flava]MBG6083498.1 signal peptidase I [Zhihengliuella flava]
MTRESSVPGPGREQTKRRSRSRGWRFVVPALAIGAVLAVLFRATLFDVFSIGSGSMEPTLTAGDRILVNRLAADEIQHSDVVVFDGTGTLAPYRSPDPVRDLLKALRLTGHDEYFVKRVIGLPGDTISCCTADGELTRNGRILEEEYVAADGPASDLEFEVTVPSDRLWLLGDHRSASADSRALLGAPGGGMIPLDRVVGRVDKIVWPLDRAGDIDENTSPHVRQ